MNSYKELIENGILNIIFVSIGAFICYIYENSALEETNKQIKFFLIRNYK